MTIQSTEAAIAIIIGMQTLPPQIDYISPAKQKEIAEAEYFINNLLEEERAEALRLIDDAVNNYYEPSFLGEDGKMYSVAAMDAMF